MAVERAVVVRGGQQTQLRAALGPRLAALAARQHGVVNRRQLRHLGFTAKQIATLRKAGFLHPFHRGVYAVGHPRLTRSGKFMAAVLAGGEGSALSHLSAGIHRELLKPFPSLPHVTAPGRIRRRPGIHFHRCDLAADEVERDDGIPVTTVARTLIDLASCLDAHRLERAVAEAEFHGRADSPSLPELLERHRGRRGVSKLRKILGSGNAERGVTRSDLEDRFLRFLDAQGLERPELNAPLQLGIRFIEVDCLWRAQRIAIELDGRDSHERKRQFEADRLRDRRLLAEGWRPARVTSEQLDSDPRGLEADLAAIGVPRPVRRRRRPG